MARRGVRAAQRELRAQAAATSEGKYSLPLTEEPPARGARHTPHRHIQSPPPSASLPPEAHGSAAGLGNQGGRLARECNLPAARAPTPAAFPDRAPSRALTPGQQTPPATAEGGPRTRWRAAIAPHFPSIRLTPSKAWGTPHGLVPAPMARPNDPRADRIPQDGASARSMPPGSRKTPRPRPNLTHTCSRCTRERGRPRAARCGAPLHPTRSHHL